MEEKNLTNQESLDLIRQMLEQTRVRIQKSSNKAELWIGYLGMAVSVAVYVGLEVTHNPFVNFLWFLMFLAFPISLYFKKKETQPETYVSKSINIAFSVVGWMFGIACLAISLFFSLSDKNGFAVLFPMSLIIMSFVCLFKGLLLRELSYQLASYVVMFLGFYLMTDLFINQMIHVYWVLGYTVACFFLFVLPNLIFNYKMGRRK